MQSLLLLLKSAQFGYFVCLIRCTIGIMAADDEFRSIALQRFEDITEISNN